MDVGSLGRKVRVVITLVLAAGVFYGTLWGDDDDFPIGPFRMYSTSRELDEPVGDTQMYAVNADGEEFQFTQTYTGMRRAELEGQLDKFEADPSRLHYLADSYATRYPDRPPIDQIRIVIEWIELDNGLPTGESTVEEVVSWQR
ncbi:MAG TPA: hypothetical protein VEX15_00080 [Nocardioidaceae bacterium]|nr:hypothetical protein [Nocardioidaceae bacterium]